MSNLLKIELKKTVINRFFVISVLIGIIFVVMSACFVVANYYSDNGVIGIIRRIESAGFSANINVEATSIYNSWIGGEIYSLGYTLFFTLMPILAMLPSGWNLFEEIRGGYLKVIIPRCGREMYFISKYISVFIGGGLSVTIPLVFSLLLVGFFIPAIRPNVIYNIYFSVFHGDAFSGVAYSAPMLFTLLFICIDFIFSGLFACLSITAVLIFKQRSASTVMPFLLVTACDMSRSFFYYIYYYEISPLKLLHAIPPENVVKLPILLAWLLVFILLSLPITLIRGFQIEIL